MFLTHTHTHKNKTAHHLKNVMLTIKRGGGRFSSAGTGTLVKVERLMDNSKYAKLKGV